MVELRTCRLILRRPQLSDVDALHTVFGDAETMQYWSTLPHTQVEKTRAFVEAMQRQHDALGSEFVVEYEGTAIGKAGLWSPPEIGFIFSRSIWGQGLGREAASAVITHGFAQMDLDQITADVDPRNARSVRLLGTLGFRETGRAKATFMLGDQVCDSVYFALQRTEWQPAARILSDP